MLLDLLGFVVGELYEIVLPTILPNLHSALRNLKDDPVGSLIATGRQMKAAGQYTWKNLTFNNARIATNKCVTVIGSPLATCVQMKAAGQYAWKNLKLKNVVVATSKSVMCIARGAGTPATADLFPAFCADGVGSTIGRIAWESNQLLASSLIAFALNKSISYFVPNYEDSYLENGMVVLLTIRPYINAFTKVSIATKYLLAKGMQYVEENQQEFKFLAPDRYKNECKHSEEEKEAADLKSMVYHFGHLTQAFLIGYLPFGNAMKALTLSKAYGELVFNQLLSGICIEDRKRLHKQYAGFAFGIGLSCYAISSLVTNVLFNSRLQIKNQASQFFIQDAYANVLVPWFLLTVLFVRDIPKTNNIHIDLLWPSRIATKQFLKVILRSSSACLNSFPADIEPKKLIESLINFPSIRAMKIFLPTDLQSISNFAKTPYATMLLEMAGYKLYDQIALAIFIRDKLPWLNANFLGIKTYHLLPAQYHNQLELVYNRFVTPFIDYLHTGLSEMIKDISEQEIQRISNKFAEIIPCPVEAEAKKIEAIQEINEDYEPKPAPVTKVIDLSIVPINQNYEGDQCPEVKQKQAALKTQTVPQKKPLEAASNITNILELKEAWNQRTNISGNSNTLWNRPTKEDTNEPKPAVRLRASR